MDLLITGASGFIGSHLTKELDLKSKDYKVLHRNYLNSSNNQRVLNNSPKCLIHLAAIAHGAASNDEFYKVNAEYPIALVEYLLNFNLKRLVFISSIGVYGITSSDQIIDEETPTNPKELYAITKLKAERSLTKLCNEFNIDLIILRPVLVYGPLAPGNLKKLAKLVNLIPILPFGCANEKRTMVHVMDLVNAIELSIDISKSINGVFNVSEDEGICTYEIVHILSNKRKFFWNICVSKRIIRTVLSLLGMSKMYEQLFGSFYVSNKKLKNNLGWNTKYSAEKDFEY